MRSLINKLVFIILAMISVTGLYAQNKESQQTLKVIIDSDTANEVDDLYAISRVLMDSSVNVLAINAVHWSNSEWAEGNTMEMSHRLNQQLLSVMGLEGNTKRGATAQMYGWGDRAQHSAAAYEIIKQVNNTPDNEKLTILALGALTNVASAIFIDPKIIPKLDLYWLGGRYDFEKEAFRNTEFNCMMDIYALNYILGSEIKMHVLPINVAKSLVGNFKDLKSRFKGNPLGEHLIKRWEDHLDPLRRERKLWDLALVEAFLNPEWTATETKQLSRDYHDKKITFYSKIDAEKMLADFIDRVLKFDTD